MKKLAFLIAAWLVHVKVLCISDDFDKAEAERIFDSISEKLLMSMTSSPSPSFHRQKRELGVEEHSLNDDLGVYRLKSVKPVSKLCHPAIQTLFLDVSNTTYAVCVSPLTADSPAEVIIGYYREHAWMPIHRWFVSSPGNAVAFHFKNHIYVLVADSESSAKSGTQVFKLNLQTNSLSTGYSVTSSFATRIAVWNMKTKGTYNLAIVNTDGYKDAADLSSEVYVYEWKGTYFDRYSTFRAFDVKDIEPFHIHDFAYMAVANFRRGKNNDRVDSEILRYDLDGNKWVSHQKIRTYGAMDWEFFSLGHSLGQEFFLALANKGDGEKARSMIYKFVVDKFVPFQCLPTRKATSFASFSDGDLFILAVANEDDSVHLYQYDGWKFVKSGVQNTKGAMSDGVQNLEFHRVTRNSENALILSVSNPKHPLYPSVFEIGLIYENSLKEWHDKSTDWCLNTLSKMESTDIDKKIGSFDDLIFIDQDSITIEGDVVFEDGFVADSLKTPKLTSISTKEVFDYELINKLADLQRRLEIIKQKLNGFSDALKNSLKIEGNQNITNRLEFQDAEFNCSSHSCHFENIYTSFLNQESIVEWQNKLVFLDSAQVIDGNLWAKEINASSVNVQGLLDGVDSRYLVTKSGNHEIFGRKVFDNLITTKNIEVTGKVDGVTISPLDVLVTTGFQAVQGNISFEELDTTWLSAKYVNGKNLSEFYHDMVLTDRSYTITGHKTFSDVTIGELTMTPESTINGVDLMDLWSNAMWINGKQEIKAEMTFSDVMFKNLKISHGVNGIQIPGPRIVDITETAHIKAPQVFQNSIKIEQLEIQESFNGITLVQAPDGSKQLDIMLKSGDQFVTGMKTFHTINLGDHSDVGGTVDGVDLSDFKTSVLRKNSSITSNGTWVFNNLIVKGPLTVGGTVSGMDLDDVYRRALKLNDTILPEMIFNNLVHVGDLLCDNISGINVSKDLVLKREPQTLMGHYTFTEIVIEETAIIRGLINNRNFSFLDEVLLRIGNQRIKSKVFKRNVSVRNLILNGTINGVPLSEIMTLKGGQLLGSRSLSNVTFAAIEAKNVEVTGTVNGINLEEMIADTMTYDGKETVTGKKDIKGTIYVMNGTDFQTRNLNGIDFKELWEDAVFVDVPQEISGVKTFADNVVFNDLSFTGNIDGVSDWEMRYNWMLTDVPQTVEGNVRFLNGFTAKDLKVKTVNGLDLKQLESSIIKVNEKAVITGTVIFEKAVTSDEDISLTGKIQGVDLSEEAVSRNKIVVTGEKTFSNDLVIEGDLTVDGLVDGVNIEDLCNKTFLRNKDIYIKHLIIKGDVTLLEEGTVGGNIAGVNLTLLDEIVKITEPEIKFSGRKTFANLTFAGLVNLKGKFGGIDVKQLNENYMSLTKDQEISAKMTFQDLVFKGILSTPNLDTANKMINNISLPELSNRILKTRGTQTVTATYHLDEAHFASDIFVAGTVNELELPSGLMRHNHTNYIQSPKIFEQVVVIKGDLEMEEGQTIQDVDVSDWFRKAVLKHGKFHIRGHKTFGKLDLNDVTVEGLLDGLKISEDNLLMTYGDQVVTKRKLVNGSVTIEGSLTVKGLINDVNLTRLSSETLQRDRDNIVTGLKHFTQPLTIISLEAPTVAGVDVVTLKEKLNTSLELNDLENRLEEIEGVVTHMQKAFDNQAVLFQYYELFDEFDFSSIYDFLYISDEEFGELLLLLDSSGLAASCSNVRIFGFDKTAGSFLPTRQELPASYSVSAQSLVLNNLTHIFLANQDPCCSCQGNFSVKSATIDIYSWNVQEFEKLQSLTVKEPIDIVAFKSGTMACLVVLEFGGSKVYCASEINPRFSERETLLTKGGQKASVIQSLGRIILAIAAEDNSYERSNYVRGQSFIEIYEWDSKKAEFSTRKQLLQATFTQSVSLMSYADGSSAVVFLVVAEGSIPKINNEPKLLVYRYDDTMNIFEKYQEIKDFGILDWLTLTTGELVFFAVDPLQGQIKVYQHKGVSGFVKIDTIKSLGVKKVRAFIRSDPEDSLNHYLALAGHECKSESQQNVFYAKILKSKLKGRRPI